MDKNRICKKGFPCGKSCVSKSRKCWADLSNDKQKVFETFTQFVNLIVGVGSKRESLINNSPPTIKQTRNELRKKLINSIQETEIESVYEELEVGYIRNMKDEIDSVKGRFKSEKFDEKSSLIIDGYTDFEYVDINNYLRGNDVIHAKSQNGARRDYSVPEDSNEMRFVAAKVVAMGRAYDKLKPIEEPVKLFRGIKRTKDADLSYYDSLKRGDEFSDGAYMSATPNEEIADEFAGGGSKGSIKLVMSMSPPTQNAKDLGAFNQIGEEEILVNKGTKFVVDRIKMRGKVKVIYLIEK